MRKRVNCIKSGVCLSISLTATALLILQLSGGGRLTASTSDEPMGEAVPSSRVIAEHPPVELPEWRDGHTRVWMSLREVELTDASGETEVQEIPGYIAEKANNLMYEEGGEFRESVAEFEARGGDFAADRNCFQLYVGTDLSKPVRCFADDALLELRAQRLSIRQANEVWVLSQTDRQVAGQMDASDSSTVIFRSALGNNDLEYRVYRDGFEQTLILNSPPETPEGCDLERAFLCIETEVSLDSYLRQTGATVKVGDEEVYVSPATFSTAPAAREAISLVSTCENPDGKLIELAVHTFGESRVFESPFGGAPRKETLAEKILYRSSQDGKVYLLERVPLAFFVGARYPVVWDYVDRVVPKAGSISADQIWDPRFTYWVTGPLTVQAKLTILPGTTVKIKPKEGANEPGITASGPSGQIVARGEPWFWITFTKESDSNCGEPITYPPPIPGPYLYAIRLLFNSSRQSEVSFCKFGYGGKGFWSEVDALANPIRNNIFYSCGAGVYLWNSHDASIRNNLFASCGRAIYPDGTSGYGKVVIANNTVDYSSYGVFLHIPDGSADVFDNVLTQNGIGVYLETGAAWVDYNCYYGNTVNTQGVNDGGHSIDDYDMTGSPYDNSVAEVGVYYLNDNQNQGALLRDAGFESVSEAGLSADAGTLNAGEVELWAAAFTVNAPQYALTSITTSTTWDPVEGDKGAVDLGYHHNRVDYLLSSSSATYVTGTNAQLTLSPGLVLATGTSSSSRLHVQNSGKLICAGDPTNATYNVITRKKALSMHIESPRFGDQQGELVISSSASDACQLKFTKFRWLYQVVTYRRLSANIDGNQFLLSPVGASAARQNSTFLSNLFWGNTKGLYFTDTTRSGDQNNSSAYNNTFDCNEYGFFVYTRNSQSTLITAKDSLFTNNGYGIYGDTGGGSTFTHHYNGYYNNNPHIWINGQSVDPNGDSTNVVLGSSPYCGGWRDANDRWYAQDPSLLKNKGSRLATSAGLDERATVWKDPLEKDSATVDIGYHYPWADFVVHPYLQNLRTDRITVMWWTAAPCLGAVKFTPAGGSEICVTDPVAQRVHEVTLWKLAADTTHSYYVESGPQRRPSQDKGSLSLTTAPETPPDKFRFVVYGDNRGGDGDASYQTDHRPVVSTMLTYSHTEQDPVRFVVHVADFAYNGGHNYEWNPQFFGPAQMTSTEYSQPHTAAPASSLIGRVAIFPSLGNHEYNLDDQADNYRRYFSLPNNERWYSFNFANCHFVILDVENSEWYDDPTDPQRVWLDADLNAAQNDAEIDWVFIAFHKPPYSYGGPHHPGETAVRNYLIPEFEQRSKVVAVFSGHSHYYQRLLKDDVPQLIDYVVTGGGGADPHTPNGSGELYWQAEGAFYHWCQIDVDNVQGTVTLRARKKGKGELIEDPYQLYPTP
ncbi:MAG: NosD domain-containing protein [bacterium]|nr:NosD domain-containing protein [bacterium]